MFMLFELQLWCSLDSDFKAENERKIELAYLHLWKEFISDNLITALNNSFLVIDNR